MKKFLEDFKSFAMKGNIVDLAIGVIIGGAFSKIVTSLVGDIIMPLLNAILGNINIAYEDLTFMGMKYGAFLKNVIDFLIISLSIFVVIKFLSRFKRKEEKKEEKAEEEKISKEVALLTEIRDLLKEHE